MAKSIARQSRRSKSAPPSPRIVPAQFFREARSIIKARRALRAILKAQRHRSSQVIAVPVGTDYLDLWVSPQEFLAYRDRQGVPLPMAQHEWVGHFISGYWPAYDCCLPKGATHWFLKPVPREFWLLSDFSASEAAALGLLHRPTPESRIWWIDDRRLLRLHQLRILAAVNDSTHEALCWPGGALRRHVAALYRGLARPSAPPVTPDQIVSEPMPTLVPVLDPALEERERLETKERELVAAKCQWARLMALVDQYVRVHGKIAFKLDQRGAKAAAWKLVETLSAAHPNLARPASDQSFYHWLSDHPQPWWLDSV